METMEARWRDAQACIVTSDDRRALDEIRRLDVQAVICTEQDHRERLAELRDAVRRRVFHVPRTRLHDVDRPDLERWLRHAFHSNGLDPEIETWLADDILWLADWLTAVCAADRYILRIFTEPPTTECGFHVDTVPPGVRTIGALRVYNGEGTAYVAPDNVTSTADFNRYLGRRERLVRESSLARKHDNEAALERIESELHKLDANPGFLLRPAEVNVAPATAIVAFRHLDAGDYWSGRSGPQAWIHCSPTSGEARLVVNLTPARPVPPSAWRARSRSPVVAIDPPA